MGKMLISRLVVFFCLLFLVQPKQLVGQKHVFLGGSIGAAIPSNIGYKEFGIGFGDVAVSAPRLALEGRWFYNPRLSLGAELAFASFGQNNSFWNVGRYGDVALSYNMAQLTAHGIYYFEDRGFRPYAGVGFGAYFMANSMTFQSAYTGTDADASTSYKTFTVKPGVSPQLGFVSPVSKKCLFYTDVKFQVIPRLKAEMVEITDDNGNVIDYVTQNPHGHQNHWVVSIGFLWALD
jgi:outer membrane protein W